MEPSITTSFQNKKNILSKDLNKCDLQHKMYNVVNYHQKQTHPNCGIKPSSEIFTRNFQVILSSKKRSFPNREGRLGDGGGAKESKLWVSLSASVLFDVWNNAT